MADKAKNLLFFDFFYFFQKTQLFIRKIKATMEYKEGQFTEEEKQAYRDFIQLASHAPHWFSHYAPTPYGTRHDVLAYNYTAGTEAVELKKRTLSATGYTDCFIEPSKLNYLKSLDTDNVMPLYVNFIGDWRDVYIWIIPNLMGNRMKHHKSVRIYTPEGDVEYVERYGLRWDDAYHFKWDGTKYNITKPILEDKLNLKKLTPAEIDWDSFNELKKNNEKKLGILNDQK